MARIANHQGFDLPKVDTMAEIGKTGDISRAYEAGSVIGGYLEEFGINLDFAPDADVLTNPGQYRCAGPFLWFGSGSGNTDE